MTLPTGLSPDTTGRAPPLAGWLAPVLLGSAALLAWCTGLGGALVYDDVPAIEANASIRSLWPPWAPFLPGRNDLTVSGRPLANWTLALNYAAGGTAPGGYHLFNLVVHVSAAFALFGVLRRTLRQPPLRARFGPAADYLALVIAGLWLLHPLQTEAVTYIIQRVESLMGLWCLLTFYCFLRATETPGRWTWPIAAVTACLAGMATKEVMVAVPLLVLLYDRTFVAGTFHAALAQRRGLYAGLAATWLPLALLVLATGNRAGSAGFGGPVTPWSYAQVQCGAVVHYLRLAFWPHPLVFDYGLVEPGPLASILLPAMVLAGLLAGTAVAVGRNHPLGFAGAWFFLILAPTSSVLPVVTEPVAEHRMYLPLAAVLAALVLGAWRWCGARSLVVFAGAAVACGWMTAQRNRDYRDAITLWTDTVQKAPENARAHNNLGSLALAGGDVAGSLRECERAVALQPYYASAHYNLGCALVQAGRPAEALPHFAQAVEIQEDFADARVNWGNALLQLGRPAEAVAQYRAVLGLQPGSADAHYNLGCALDQVGAGEEARREFEAALRLEPGLTVAHIACAALLARTGDVPGATEHYRLAIRQKPGAPGVRFALGNLLARAGDLPGAIAQLSEARRLDPANPRVANNLGNALLVAGRYDDAIAQYEAVLQLDPADAKVRDNLAVARAKKARQP
ncbi:MAG TPA: tetratricopeptide repeat protein [Lacunisphaera sp.]|nr:tetratricopeptide repeat protein [Lacunisphaera sp.]